MFAEILGEIDLKQNTPQSKPKTKEIPEAFYKDIVTAAALLDAVAQFELEGSKWMLGLPAHHWDEELHEHCFDEVRHTKMVQDAAKLLRWKMSDEQILREAKINRHFQMAIERYLSRLSKKVFKMAISHGVGNLDFSKTAYSLLSFAIERRIMKIYPHFAKLTPSEDIRKLARRIIKDERKHLGFVGDKIEQGLEKASTTQLEVIQIEEKIACDWVKEMIYAVEAV